MSDTHKTESLHDQIMRLPCTPPKDANVNQSISYKSGHRDARHAAAELAAEHEAEQQQELTAIEAMARMLADGEWAEHVGELGGPIAQRLETEITRMHNEQQAAQAAVPDENGLLPCPFCGGKAELHQRETESLWSHNQVTWSQVGCCECECVGADCCEDDDGSEAVAHWNTRAADPSAPTPPAQQIQWVPVSERLPEIDTPVFLYEPNFGIWIGGCADADDGWMWAHAQGTQWFADGEWKADLFIDDDYKPSHWMPLPAAPGDTAAPEQAEQPHPVNRSVIRDVFLRNGFTIKEGHADLKPYVYAAAEELLALDGKAVAAEQDSVKVPRELLCRITRNGGVDTLLAIDELRDLLGGGA
ncbi:DUF551 domain-containing protein [Azotobacter chroococcum]|uniref:DUF551 domain-containing protein n=1 Tax=Azotobacter chroococcum TaxID=353 RepID=UPI0010AE279C|nr:DUF551 domain-containing protein [Azotobacter chroococcum]TKD30025.1 DUF551 domain-containing protein [Azotobacter chroococcum]